MKTWTREESKADLPDGPWQSEPDKAHWVDEATDLDCLIVRNHSGALCGYVGVPPSHPGHGREYDDVRVAVHGGLTYAAFCQEDTIDPAVGVCHVPLPGREENVWWFGFDCAHYSWDLIPHMLKLEQEDEEFAKITKDMERLTRHESHYWTFDEVVEEVTRLAAQLARIPEVMEP